MNPVVMFMVMLLLHVVCNCNKERQEATIANFIKTATIENAWCQPASFIININRNLNRETLISEAKKFPIKINYGNRVIYMVIQVIPEPENDYNGLPKRAVFTLIIPPLRDAQSGSDHQQWQKMRRAVPKQDDSHSYLIIKYNKHTAEYEGDNTWLSTSNKVGITDWGYGKGKTMAALKMANWLWKHLGIDTAQILDYATFPCEKTLMGNQFRHTGHVNRDTNSKFGLARIVRLFQGKAHVSIYNKGGYFSVNTMDTKDIMDYTVYKLLNEDFSERPTWSVTGSERANWDRARARILAGVPDGSRSPLDSEFKLKDALVRLYNAKCRHYYKVMKYIFSLSNSAFRTALVAWIGSTEILQLNNIQSTTFNDRYYLDILHSPGSKHGGKRGAKYSGKREENTVEKEEENIVENVEENLVQKKNITIIISEVSRESKDEYIFPKKTHYNR